LPEGTALRLGEVLGWVVGVVLRIRWRTVKRHLCQAFPERNEEWCRATARASYRHLGKEAVATFRLGGMDAGEVRRRTEMVGFDEVRKAAAEGRGVIVMTGHFGNWEIGGAALAAYGLPTDVVAQRQRNPLFDTELLANRNRLGLQVIERREAPRGVFRSLRSGRTVGILADQNVRRSGLFVEFFGRLASTARGPALFAIRTGCPVFLGMSRSQVGIPQRYRVTFQRVEFSPSGNLEEDILRLTEAHTRLLEEEIREAPEQYFWQHRRWKTRPPRDDGKGSE
jgi:KDO2-lipid IV(A) lauroyltransferase